MPVLGNPNPHVRKVCEYIFESEEHDFTTQIDENSELTDREKALLLDFVDQGQIKPSKPVVDALKKINHVYAHAALAYME